MADKTEKNEKDTSSLEIEPQDNEEREEVLRRAPAGDQTATGQARIEHFEEREEPENRGSELEIAGGEPQPTLSTKKGANKPRGLQKEEAKYTVNGTVPYGMVASPTGPVPVSAVSATPDAASRRLQQEEARVAQEVETQRSYDALTDEQISTLRPNELRAIGADRGYDLPAGGARAIRRRFAEAQTNDPMVSGSDTSSDSDESSTTEGQETGNAETSQE